MPKAKDIQYNAIDKNLKKGPNESHHYRSTLIGEDEPLCYQSEEGVDTIKKQFIRSVERFGDRPFLGTRAVDGHNDEGKPIYGKYEYKTYSEVFNDSTSLAKAFVSNEFYSYSPYDNKEHKFIGVYSKNNEAWITTDMACCMAGIGTVTLYDTLGADSSEYIIKQTSLRTVVCTADHIKDLVKIKENGEVDELKNIIVMDNFTDSDINDGEELGLKLFSIKQLIESGASSDTVLDDPEIDDLYTLCYTSGTTGNPKGVMLSHKNCIALLAAIDKSPIEFTEIDVHLSYLPLSHIMERVIFMGLMSNGARIGFYQGDVMKIKEDLIELKPTVFISVPRLFTKFYDLIQGKLSNATGLKKKLANMAIKSKIANLHKTGSVKSCMWDKLVFNKMKAALGGRVRICITGSAPISKEVMDFLKIAFCCPMVEGYGQTETAGAACSTFPDDPETGHVGGVYPCSLMKLLDVPDMEYLHTDERDGVTYPRGEICFKGASNFSGYFKEPEKTKETIDEDGWVHTGDIGEIQPNGALRIIDRKKNIFKLSQGEYIAAEKLEILFSKHPLIAQMFVYGDSLQSYLVTVIVPDKLEVEKDHGGSVSDYHDHINSDDFKNKIFDWFQSVKKEHKLISLEIPKKIFCTDDEFKVEDGTLTPTFKLIRGESKKKFIEKIKEMYDGEKLQGE